MISQAKYLKVGIHRNQDFLLRQACEKCNFCVGFFWLYSIFERTQQL